MAGHKVAPNAYITIREFLYYTMLSFLKQADPDYLSNYFTIL